MFSSVALLSAILCVILIMEGTVGAGLPKATVSSGPFYKKSLPKMIVQKAVNRPEASSIGVKFKPSSIPIIPQAVGDVLIQALYTTYEEYGTQPSALHASFNHSVSATGPRAPAYAARVQIMARGNQTGDYKLTTDRIAITLSLLGFDFAHNQNLTDLVEFDFDVVVDKWRSPEVVIAQGYLRNNIDA